MTKRLHGLNERLNRIDPPVGTAEVNAFIDRACMALESDPDALDALIKKCTLQQLKAILACLEVPESDDDPVSRYFERRSRGACRLLPSPSGSTAATIVRSRASR